MTDDGFSVVIEEDPKNKTKRREGKNRFNTSFIFAPWKQSATTLAQSSPFRRCEVIVVSPNRVSQSRFWIHSYCANGAIVPPARHFVVVRVPIVVRLSPRESL